MNDDAEIKPFPKGLHLRNTLIPTKPVRETVCVCVSWDNINM